MDAGVGGGSTQLRTFSSLPPHLLECILQEQVARITIIIIMSTSGAHVQQVNVWLDRTHERLRAPV